MADSTDCCSSFLTLEHYSEADTCYPISSYNHYDIGAILFYYKWNNAVDDSSSCRWIWIQLILDGSAGCINCFSIKCLSRTTKKIKEKAYTSFYKTGYKPFFVHSYLLRQPSFFYKGLGIYGMIKLCF